MANLQVILVSWLSYWLSSSISFGKELRMAQAFLEARYSYYHPTNSIRQGMERQSNSQLPRKKQTRFMQNVQNVNITQAYCLMLVKD